MIRTTLARLILVLGLIFQAGGAGATYVFESIDFPGSSLTQTFGINNNGQVTVNTSFGSFVYLSGQWIPLPAPSAAGLGVASTGINDALVVVGIAAPLAPPSSPEQGFILNLQTATYTEFFSQPGWDNTEARGINDNGLIVGFSTASGPSPVCPVSFCSVGFIYDPSLPAGQQFTDITPPGNQPGASLILTQGINRAGQVVGSFHAQGTLGSTAFLREPDGTINTFRINDGPTSARGINDNGLIAGFVGVGGVPQPFVGDSSGFQLLTCPASVCPGATGIFALGINNAGQIVGDWADGAGNSHGFIATPATLPVGTTANGAYVFNVDVVPNVEIFIDPSVAAGYDYAIGDGNPMFASVQLPIGIGNSLYTLIIHGHAFALAGGDVFDFRTHGFPNGVAQFRVADIEQSAGLDPADPTAFVTGVSFVAAGSFTGTMTPLCQGHSLPGQAKVPPGRSLSPCGG